MAETLAAGPEVVMPGSAEYDAFISYSHAADGQLAPALQTGLQSLGKPWYRRRALRVFRDKTSLSATPELWPTIEHALAGSRYSVVLASPDAAQSRWVEQEVAWWRAHRSASTVLIGLTGGELAWDHARQAFDPTRTTALPPSAVGWFTREPLWVDLRWARQAQHVSLRDPRFRECVADLTAPIRGIAKDELIGEDIRQHRRALRLVRGGVTLLALLTALAVVAAFVAVGQRNTAREQTRIARAGQAAATAVASVGSRLDLAQLLGVAAYQLDQAPQATAALLRTVGESPHLVRYLQAGAPVSALSASRDGSVLAAGTVDGRVLTWELRTGRRTEADLGDRPIRNVALDARGSRVAAADGDRAQVWPRDPNSKPITLAAATRQPADLVALSPSGSAAAVVYQQDVQSAQTAPAGPLLAVHDSESGSVRATVHDKISALLVAEAAPRFVGFDGESRLVTIGFSGAGTAWTLTGRRLTRAWRMRSSLAPGNNYLPAYGAGGAYFAYVTSGEVTACRLPQPQSGACRGGGGNVPTEAFERLAISPDGYRAAVAAAGTVYLTRTASAQQSAAGGVVALTGNSQIEQLTYLGNSGRLASASGSSIALWDPAQISRLAQPTGIRVPYQYMADPVPRVAIAPDGDRIAVFGGFGSPGGDQIYDLRSGRTLARLGGGRLVTRLAEWSSDGAWLVAVHAGAGGRIWQLRGATPGLQAEWSSDGASGAGGAILAARILVNQQQLLLVSAAGSVVLRSLMDGQVVEQVQAASPGPANQATIDAAAISDDGNRIALLRGNTVDLVARDGKPLASTTIADATEIAAVHRSRRQVTLQSGGTVVIRGTDGAISFWDPRSSRIGRRITIGGRSSTQAAIAPHGDLIVTLQDDGVAVVTDIASGERVGTFRLPEPDRSFGGGIGVISALAFAPDSGMLMSVTAGGTIVGWELSSAGLLRIACATVGRDLTTDEWRRYTGITAPTKPACRQ